MTWLEPLYSLIVTVLFLLLAIGLVLSSLFRQRIQESHPDTWRELGEPGPPWNTSSDSQRRLARFRWRGHRVVGDPVLSRLAIVLNWLAIVAVIAFLAMVTLLLLPLPQP